ncbi:hypothetical protein DL93DRAFT_2051601, partial [Clavulina sp. PMI_390]
DPAIERWQLMRDSQYMHFKWTPLKTRQVVNLMIVVPALCGLLAYSTDLRWDWAGKLKGQSLLRNPPAKQEDQE